MVDEPITCSQTNLRFWYMHTSPDTVHASVWTPVITLVPRALYEHDPGIIPIRSLERYKHVLW